MSRGNNFQDIFLSDDDRHLFCDLLGELSERFAIEIYVYLLMETHYHLLLKTTEANLSKAMQWFGTTYTRKFNLYNRTRGHLFQGRFKSIIVPLAMTFQDPDHSIEEERQLTFGQSLQRRLIVVSHTKRGKRTRIINARLMDRNERVIYEEG